METIKINIEEIKNKRQIAIKAFWGALEPFKTVDDIPELPKVNEVEWNNFFVPKLIELGAIPKNKLIVGQWYLGNCRNTEAAMWNGQKFIYKIIYFNNEIILKIREKFFKDGIKEFKKRLLPLKLIKK